MNNPTPVVFRTWKSGGGVLALFPTLPAEDGYGRFCMSYEHAGQHGGANYWLCMKASRRSTPKESASLLEELLQLGYRPFEVVKANSLMHKQRAEEAKRIRKLDL